MMFLAKGIIIFKKKNHFKKIEFEDEKKAQRAYEKYKRKGMDVQLVY